MRIRRIGNVTILAELGQGAHSHVFQVHREADGRVYALKIVSINHKRDQKYLMQSRHEYRIGRMLDHPNLVKVYSLETEGGWFSGPTKVKLLIEFAPGVPLNQISPFPIARLLRVFERIADALDHMHMKGVIHADLKPSNLILGRDSQVKVIDYGLAWVKGEPKDRVQGTPEYMAPETVAHKLVNERTDIYNFGATLYRLVTRHFPPLVTPGLPLTRKAFARLFHPVEEFAPETPVEVRDLIHRCLSFDPHCRPATAREVRVVLNRLASLHADTAGQL